MVLSMYMPCMNYFTTLIVHSSHRCTDELAWILLTLPQKQYDNNNSLISLNELVTCGNIPDPRIQFEVDVATTITLVFKSDEQNEFQGLNLYILEIKPSSTDPVRMMLLTKYFIPY